MKLEIRPEPPPDARAAIAAALERAGRQETDQATPGAWWEAGLRESLGLDDAFDGDGFDQATAPRPRRSVGATRA